MEQMKQIMVGIYEFMLNVKVPVFGYFFTLWEIFLFGMLGFLVVWFLLRFFK